MSTAGKKTKMMNRNTTNAFYAPLPASLSNMRAPEVCGGPSPQQVNTIKVDLASDLIDKNGPPPHTVLFRKDGRAQLAFSNKIAGVTMEDASPKGNPRRRGNFWRIAAYPKEIAEDFKWGDFVAVKNATVSSGFDKDQKIAAVFEAPKIQRRKMTSK